LPEERRKFKHEPAHQRKDALIEAALSLIAEKGVRGATVRAIAERAGVTQGMIRHHFTSKEDLITAAYEHHMNHMNNLTIASAKGVDGAALDQLVAFVDASLKPPVVDPRSIALWAGFLNKVNNDDQMKRIHERTYIDFRDHVEGLIHAALTEAGRQVGAKELRRLATACNALIDGLWLEGGALPDAFEAGELTAIGLHSVGAIIGIPLEQKAEMK
jgi:TetR/AcrR family transcriptional repressor of bet genes